MNSHNYHVAGHGLLNTCITTNLLLFHVCYHLINPDVTIFACQLANLLLFVKGIKMSKFSQVSAKNAIGNSIFSINHDTPAKVEGLNIYRHSGDMYLGIEDSWFLCGTVLVESHDGQSSGEVFVSHDAFRKHGMPLEVVEKLLLNILRKGEINLNLWTVS